MRPITRWNRESKVRALCIKIRMAAARIYDPGAEWVAQTDSQKKRVATISRRTLNRAVRDLNETLARPVIEPKKK